MDSNACLVFTYTKDRYELLQRSIDSMLQNPGYPIRVWVIDNGNNDGSSEYLLKKLKDGYLEKVILEINNVGIHHAINEVKTLLFLTSENPYIPEPKYVMLTNDDITYEDNWLKECVETYEELRSSPYRISILSPFHCKNLNGDYAEYMIPQEYWNDYPISDFVSGNTLFMDTSLFTQSPLFPTDNPTEMGDWKLLYYFKNLGYKCARTKIELAHHMPESQCGNKYDYLRHW